MSPPPMPFQWNGESMVPRRPKWADEHFVIGETYDLAPVEERSEASHRHEFAWMREAWLNLPEDIEADYPNPETLRKKALISTGFYTVRDYVCASQAEAIRTGATIRSEADEYAVVKVVGNVVRVYRAKSQSRRAMKGPEFQLSKTAILEWVANLIGVTPEELRGAEAA